MTRPSWSEYFLTLAEHAASRATCPRLSVGAVVVRDKRVLSTGYNGAPSGLPHCSHPVDVKCTEAVHAEENALDGGPYPGATMYLTHSPCHPCQDLIVGAGIVRVVYRIPYRDPDLSTLECFGIAVEHEPKPTGLASSATDTPLIDLRDAHARYVESRTAWIGWPY